MSERGKRRNIRKERQKEKIEEKEKEKDNERERSRDKEKERTKNAEEKKQSSKSGEEQKEEKKNKNEKIMNKNLSSSPEKSSQDNLIILPLEGAPKELSQYSSIKLNKEALLDLLKCPLCKGYYRTPYTINECMHTFCRSCIFKYFCSSNQREKCPICDTKIGGRPMDSLIFDNYLDSLINIIFPQFEELDKKNKSILYKTYRDAGIPLPGDEEEEKSSLANIKIFIKPENSKENKFNGVFLVPKIFDVYSLKDLISKKEGYISLDSIVVKFKDNELTSKDNYTMEVINSKYGFDQDKNIFYYYIKNNDEDKE